MDRLQIGKVNHVQRRAVAIARLVDEELGGRGAEEPEGHVRPEEGDEPEEAAEAVRRCGVQCV